MSGWYTADLKGKKLIKGDRRRKRNILNAEFVGNCVSISISTCPTDFLCSIGTTLRNCRRPPAVQWIGCPWVCVHVLAVPHKFKYLRKKERQGQRSLTCAHGDAVSWCAFHLDLRSGWNPWPHPSCQSYCPYCNPKTLRHLTSSAAWNPSILQLEKLFLPADFMVMTCHFRDGVRIPDKSG